jgi:hypothetical protein
MMRLRRYKPILIERFRPYYIDEIAREFIPEDHKFYGYKGLVETYSRNSAQRQKLADALAKQNLTTDLIDARAYCRAHSSDEVQVEAMLASLQLRRDAIIREIGAYRDSLARRVKKAIDDVIDVQEDEVGITPSLAQPARKESTAE